MLREPGFWLFVITWVGILCVCVYRHAFPKFPNIELMDEASRLAIQVAQRDIRIYRLRQEVGQQQRGKARLKVRLAKSSNRVHTLMDALAEVKRPHVESTRVCASHEAPDAVQAIAHSHGWLVPPPGEVMRVHYGTRTYEITRTV